MTTIAPNTAPNTAAAALKQLFESWLELWQTCGVPADELKQLFPLLEKIGKVTEGEGRLPFAIIARAPALTLSERMAKVVLDGNIGANYLTDNRVTNLDDIPQGHYLAIDVEDGRAMLNTKPSVCLAQFKKAKRFGGTVNEGISTVMYEPDILRCHYIDLPGSRYVGVCVPYLREKSGEPELDARGNDNTNPHCGSLSCGGRLALES